MTEWPTSFLGRLPIVQTDLKGSAHGFIAHALESRGKGRRPFSSTSANGQVLALCGKDEAFLSLMRKTDQIHADGMPMVLYFSRDEEDEVIAEINAARPDILWVGLGVPLEQQFIERNIDRLTGVGVIKTSGGLFDFISGKNARAPAWMQAAGLEWLYRVWLEPRRLAMRYLTTNPQAIGALIRHSA